MTLARLNNSKIGSILLISQGGSSLGDAVADVISGKGVPSGKLSATWAKSYLDYPFAEDFSDENIFPIHITKRVFLSVTDTLKRNKLSLCSRLVLVYLIRILK